MVCEFIEMSTPILNEHQGNTIGMSMEFNEMTRGSMAMSSEFVEMSNSISKKRSLHAIETSAEFM